MSSFVVDGFVLPIPIGGHPALDFCNTRAAWGSAQPKEYLASYGHLAIWSRENGLLEPAISARLRRAADREPVPARDVLRRAVRLRDALYAVLVGPGAARDWGVLQTELRAAGRQLRLRPSARSVPGGGIGEFDHTAAAGLELPLLALAWSAAELLTGPASPSVRTCAAEGCGWLFTDPRGRRRWCSMADCGNRAKARRHAQRLRPTA